MTGRLPSTYSGEVLNHSRDKNHFQESVNRLKGEKKIVGSEQTGTSISCRKPIMTKLTIFLFFLL